MLALVCRGGRLGAIEAAEPWKPACHFLLRRLSLQSAAPSSLSNLAVDVRFVPKADIPRCNEERRYSITSSAVDIEARIRRRRHRLSGFKNVVDRQVDELEREHHYQQQEDPR